MSALRLAMVATGLLLSQAASGNPLKLDTVDGVRVAATHSGAGERGVILVHGANGDAADFANFSARLAANGFSVLNVDLRGHGESRAAAETLAEDDWPAMVGEIDAASAWLMDHEAQTVAVVGSAFGASLALHAAQDSDQITNVVMLSPSLSAHGLKVSSAISNWRGPLLIVADARDPAASRTASLLGERAGAKARVELVDAGVAGHRMLNTVPDLEATLVGWLNGSRGEGAELARPDRDLEAGAPTSIETKGTTYGDKP